MLSLCLSLYCRTHPTPSFRRLGPVDLGLGGGVPVVGGIASNTSVVGIEVGSSNWTNATES